MKGVRPTDLAKELGVSVPYAHQLITGKRGQKISIDYAHGIARALDMTPESLFAPAENDLPGHTVGVQETQGGTGASHTQPLSSTVPPVSVTPEVAFAGSRSPSVPSADPFSELLAAAEAFKYVSKSAAEWSQFAAAWEHRLQTAAIRHDRREDAMARLGASEHDVKVRQHHRRDESKRRRPAR